MSPLSKIIWIRENDPVLFRATYKFISIKEYIWHKLFDEFKIDHSLASASGLFDIEQLTWNEKALQLAGVSADALSEPVNTFYSNTTKKGNLLIPAGIPFVAGAGDGCMANLGSLAIEPGIAAITIGTSGAVRLANSKPIRNFKAMTFNYILDAEHFICGGPVNNGGIALQWFIKSFSETGTLSEKDYTEFFAAIETIEPGANGLIFLPYLTGERAPLWDSDTCGSFFGIRLHHSKAHFGRAALEGICFALNEVLQAVETHSEEIKQINVSGGFVHSKTWMQLLADITGKKIMLVQSEDASAIGAAFLAMKALGIDEHYPSLSELEKEAVIEPDSARHAAYSKNFAIFKQLYPLLSDTMHQLQHLNS